MYGFYLLLILTGIAERSLGGKASPGECTNYVGSIQTANLQTHLRSLQAIATANGNTRAVGTSGYTESVEYVKSTLRKFANCEISTQPFTVQSFKLYSSSLVETFPENITFSSLDYRVLDYSGSGELAGTASPLPGAVTGCDESDWVGFEANRIALVSRGECNFATKVGWATLYNASAVLIYNTDTTGPTTGTLGSSQSLVVMGITNFLGSTLLDNPDAELFLSANTSVLVVPTENVLCTSPEGNPDATIVVGSHLDSVPAGPGINDNGSGTSVNLELAIQAFASNLRPFNNRVIFAWWAAEELGLLGSSYFVQNASAEGTLPQIALNLNFDMLGSSNGIRQVLHGAEAEDPNIRAASGTIQKLFETYFNSSKYPFEYKAFNGRSDYGPFISNGIPAGGLATGAEVIKTQSERDIYGGVCNTPFDPCYHQSCDNIENVNLDLLRQMGQASAYTLEKLIIQPDLFTFLDDEKHQTREFSSSPSNHKPTDGIWPFYQ